jgi:hypothetical protein
MRLAHFTLSIKLEARCDVSSTFHLISDCCHVSSDYPRGRRIGLSVAHPASCPHAPLLAGRLIARAKPRTCTGDVGNNTVNQCPEEVLDTRLLCRLILSGSHRSRLGRLRLDMLYGLKNDGVSRATVPLDLSMTVADL